MARIIFTVTNNLHYDQRMQRICSSLTNAGYDVLLVGVYNKRKTDSLNKVYSEKRIPIFFKKGFLFYAEYNLRLFFFLLFHSADCYCAIDLDTIVPVYFASYIRKRKRVYDAHELFTELNEVVSRKHVHHFWLGVERFIVPKFTDGYTVNNFIKDELNRRYNVNYAVIRNLPILNTLATAKSIPQLPNQYILYQGAVNEGRSFETLIPAMLQVNTVLVICGQGNFSKQLNELISKYKVEDKVILKGLVAPNELRTITAGALFGLTLFENKGLNQYYSLANRFFDYIMGGIPQICVNYPEYKILNDEYDIALTIENTSVDTIATALNRLLNDIALQQRLKDNCIKARTELNWQYEEKKLIDFWKNICI